MKKYLTRILMVIFLMVAMFSGYKIFSYFYEGKVAESFIDDLKEEYYSQSDSDGSAIPESPEEVRVKKFKALRMVNEDVVGWVRVPGTNVDYPVVQARNNQFYLRRDLKKEYAIRGSIFMDYTSSGTADKFQTIIYGHNMKDGSMFGALKKFKKKDFFDENLTIEYDFPEGTTEWEIFSVYIYKLGDNSFEFELENEKEFKEYVLEVAKKSMHKDKAVDGAVKKALDNGTNRMLTLMTCTYEYDNSRLIVHALLKED